MINHPAQLLVTLATCPLPGGRKCGHHIRQGRQGAATTAGFVGLSCLGGIKKQFHCTRHPRAAFLAARWRREPLHGQQQMGQASIGRPHQTCRGRSSPRLRVGESHSYRSVPIPGRASPGVASGAPITTGSGSHFKRWAPL